MAQNVFTHHMNVNGDNAELDLGGALNEDAKLPVIPPSIKSLTIRLHNVTQLNSLGVRAWCVWMQKLPPPLKIQLEGCPLLFVKSISLIRGVLTSNTTINSMYLPFFSPNSKEESDILLVRGKHFTARGIITLPAVDDSEGNPMELDQIAKSYLTVLFEGR